MKIPKAFEKLHREAMRGKDAWAAIRCHCVQCFGWVSGQVPGCTSPACPLFPYRLGYDRTLQNRPIESMVPENDPAKDAMEEVGEGGGGGVPTVDAKNSDEVSP